MRRLFAYARNTWRTLTSMGTALVLLFLLALGAIPGALLPQRSLNEFKVEQYIAEHPTIGPWLDRLQAFEVFSSFWFTAIYALLFISLVGCLTPRLIEHARSLRATPVPAPRNLSRLPKHHTVEASGDPEAVAAAVSTRTISVPVVMASLKSFALRYTSQARLRSWGSPGLFCTRSRTSGTASLARPKRAYSAITS